jgi:hypothetical protein
MFALFLLVVAALSIRAARYMNVPGEPDFERWVMQDYRDGLYYPVVSFLEGEVPYDADRHREIYPVLQPFSLYSPLHLLIHVPWGLLAHGFSQWLYFGFTIGLTLFVSWSVLAMCDLNSNGGTVLGLSSLILVSRPGHWNLLLGQITMELVLAVYVALFFGSRRPWISGIALAMATMKPTFGVPLALLMLANGFVRSVAIGLTVAVAVTILPTGVLGHSAGGLTPLVDSVLDTYGIFGTSLGDGPFCPVRIDGVAFLSRLAMWSAGSMTEFVVFFGTIGAAGFAVWRLRRSTRGLDTDLYCIAVSSLAILVCTYQQTYSALLLILPLTALVGGRWAPTVLSASPMIRRVLAVLLLIPAVNYLGTWSVANMYELGSWPWRIVVSISSAAILAAFVIYVGLVLRRLPLMPGKV